MAACKAKESLGLHFHDVMKLKDSKTCTPSEAEALNDFLLFFLGLAVCFRKGLELRNVCRQVLREALQHVDPVQHLLVDLEALFRLFDQSNLHTPQELYIPNRHQLRLRL